MPCTSFVSSSPGLDDPTESGSPADFVNLRYDPEAIAKLTAQKAFAAKWALLDPLANVRVASSIEEAINTVRGLVPDLKETDTVQAFITGSLHLVGAALAILEGADAL